MKKEKWEEALDQDICYRPHICDKLSQAIKECDIRIDCDKSPSGKLQFWYGIPRLSKAYAYKYGSDEREAITTKDFLRMKYCPFCGGKIG